MPTRTTITRRTSDGSRREVQALEVVGAKATPNSTAIVLKSVWLADEQQLHSHHGGEGGRQFEESGLPYEIARLAQEFGPHCSLALEVRSASEATSTYEVYPPGHWPMLFVELEAITGP